MKKYILITFASLLLIGLVYGSVQSISKMFIGLFENIPDNIGNVQTYIDRTRFQEKEINSLSWEEYRPLEKERLSQEARYAEVAKEVLEKLRSKGQLSG